MAESTNLPKTNTSIPFKRALQHEEAIIIQ
jgi:hypothetical protein